MAVSVDSDFANEQKVWVKRAMKGRPLYFGLQAKAAKSGKFLLSRRPGEVKPTVVKSTTIYTGKDADSKNTIPGSVSTGVAVGENGVLTLHFERGKALPVAEKFVKYFLVRALKCRTVKKVVIAEDDQLPAVPESVELDGLKATPETIRVRAMELQGWLERLGDRLNSAEELIRRAIDGTSTDVEGSDDLLDEAEYLIGQLERLISCEHLLAEIEQSPVVAAEIVHGIRTNRLEVARQQLQSGDAEAADETLDVAEQSIANLQRVSGSQETEQTQQETEETEQETKETQAGTSRSETEEPERRPGQVDPEKASTFFRNWLDGIKPDLKRLKDGRSADLSTIAVHVKNVSSASQNADWSGAAESWKQASALIARALSQLQAKAALLSRDAEKPEPND